MRTIITIILGIITALSIIILGSALIYCSSRLCTTNRKKIKNKELSAGADTSYT